MLQLQRDHTPQTTWQCLLLVAGEEGMADSQTSDSGETMWLSFGL